MKEFIEKLIGRLEEEKKKRLLFEDEATEEEAAWYFSGSRNGLADAIEIVNQLAEEYNTIDVNELFEEMEQNDGWIPCSEKMPERNKCVLCYAKSTARGGDTWFVGSCDNGFWFLQTAIGTLGYPTQYEVIAWQPLPVPYQPKGE